MTTARARRWWNRQRIAKAPAELEQGNLKGRKCDSEPGGASRGYGVFCHFRSTALDRVHPFHIRAEVNYYEKFCYTKAASNAFARSAALVDENNRKFEIDDPAGFLLLGSALEAFDDMRKAQAILEKDGLTIKDRWGHSIPQRLYCGIPEI